MPNAGKSSLFNALTRAGAEAANYPFTTIEPNVAVVPVADERLERGRRDRRGVEIVPDTIDFHDIAGLVAGAHEGEGLGNQFLANIRETDAIVHVVRAHGDAERRAPRGPRRPAAPTSRRSRPSSCSPTSSRPSGGSSAWTKQARGGDSARVAEEALAARGDRGAAGRAARRARVPRARRTRPTRCATCSR